MVTLVKDADRMMIRASVVDEGIEFGFADGQEGVAPWSELPEVDGRTGSVELKLPNPYELVVLMAGGERVELPWDFVRDYCDSDYRARVEAVAERGRQGLGAQIRQMRATAGPTQAEVAKAAGIGRVTQVRLEAGERSPRYGTLVALASALGCGVEVLVGGAEVGKNGA